MKLKSCLLLLFLALFFIHAADSTFAQTDNKSKNLQKIQLFNGKDLSNWEFKLKDPSVVSSEVFKVQNGVIQIKGDPFGYMRSKDTFSDYKLHVEWRWPVEATNSGVFVHAQLPDTIWIKCIECQLQAGNAGDFVCMNGADINERTDKRSIKVKKMGPSSEKPVGEWNTMEVYCKGSTIEVHVNGVLQNKATGVTVTRGHICLQSEGGTVEFRNVWLQKEKK